MANHKKEYKYHSINELERNLIVAGKAPRTVQSYCRAIRMLGEHFGCDPSTLLEKQVRDYLIYCRDVKKWKHYTLKIVLTAAKFFFNYCSENKWQIWDFAKPPRCKPEILILTPSQIKALIGKITVTLNRSISYCIIFNHPARRDRRRSRNHTEFFSKQLLKLLSLLP